MFTTLKADVDLGEVLLYFESKARSHRPLYVQVCKLCSPESHHFNHSEPFLGCRLSMKVKITVHLFSISSDRI